MATKKSAAKTKKKPVVKVVTPRALNLSQAEKEKLKEHFRQGMAQIISYQTSGRSPISEINITRDARRTSPKKKAAKKTAKAATKKKK